MPKMLIKRRNSSDKHRPGHYLKIGDSQLISTSQMTAIYAELDATPIFRGVKIVLLWGRYETGPDTYNFSAINAIRDQMKARGKYLMISIAWREFDENFTNTRILPSYMLASDGVHTDATGNAGLSHTTFKYAWAYEGGTTPNKTIPGYNIKLWSQPGDPNGSTYVMTRVTAFMNALGAAYDLDPTVIQIATNESAMNTPVVTFGSGTNQHGSISNQENGQDSWVTAIRNAFPNTPVAYGLNFTRANIATRIPTLEGRKLGINTPNSNWKEALNDPTGNPGILVYFPTWKGILHLCAEIQGDEMTHTLGNDPSVTVANYDFPPNEQLYERTIALGDSFCIWQRLTDAKTPCWQGGLAVGGTWAGRDFGIGILGFLQTHPALKTRGIGGGMYMKKPTALI